VTACYNAGMSEPVPDCPRCVELLARIAQLEQQVRTLEGRLGQNASNSSLPPSARVGAPKSKDFQGPTACQSGVGLRGGGGWSSSSLAEREAKIFPR